MSPTARPGARAEKTRAAILEAAEAIFSECGFASTRLEDVAERVGIRRASIVYHFKDKQELYESVLDSVLGGLLKRLEPVLSAPTPLPDRIENAVSTWVDYLGSRPSMARLLLREVADASPGRRPPILRYAQPIADLIRREIITRPDFKTAKLTPIDPVHLTSMVVGSTVFFVAAMPSLVPESGIDPVSPEHIAALRDEMLRIVRRLLGTRGPRATTR